MALTQAQKDAIQRQLKKNIAKRAATQKTKISDSEARKISSTMNKRAGGSPSFTLKDRTLLTKSELDALGRTSKANAEQEKKIQKQRKFAKGEGKLPVKERVGTKAEYKKLGEEIKTRKQLIAYAKQARKNQAERAKNPKAKPAKAAPAAQATPEKAAKPVAAKKTTAKKTTPAKKTAAPKFKEQTSGYRETPLTEKQKKASAKAARKETIKNTKKYAPKGSNVIIDTPVTKGGELEKKLLAEKKAAEAPKTTKAKKTSKPKSTPKKMLGPAKPVMGPLVDQPRFFPGPQKSQPKLQTLEEAKAKAPTPKPATAAPKAPETPSKAPGKVATKVASAKSAVGSTKAGKVVKAVKAASKPIAEAASKTTTAKVVKKVAKPIVKPGPVSKLLGKASIAYVVGKGVAKEINQIGSGQTSKDFNRIQALENRIAKAKGEGVKYTRSGTNRNLVAASKVDLGNALSIATGGIVGKSRKERLQELKVMLKKAEAKKAPANTPKVKPAGKTPVITTPSGQKVGGTSKAPVGDKYTVKKGDTLSAIASRSGVSLKELRAANPKFATQAKYKNGNMIFSGTSVAIPKKKK